MVEKGSAIISEADFDSLGLVPEPDENRQMEEPLWIWIGM
jgi:hypothetical protein